MDTVVNANVRLGHINGTISEISCAEEATSALRHCPQARAYIIDQAQGLERLYEALEEGSLDCLTIEGTGWGELAARTATYTTLRKHFGKEELDELHHQIEPAHQHYLHYLEGEETIDPAELESALAALVSFRQKLQERSASDLFRANVLSQR